MPTADFSRSNVAVNVNLAAGVATSFLGTVGVISTEASMLTGENGFDVFSLFTTGETLFGTSGVLNSSTAGSYTPVGVFDGIGAYRLDGATVRVLVNHEISAGPAYTVSDGGSGVVTLSGARISYFDIDVTTMAIVDGGLAFDLIHDRQGQIVTSAAQFEIPGGLTSFCSSLLVDADPFGAGRGTADRIYFTGEEASGHLHGGSVWALDVATGALWAVPAFGRARFENVAELDTGDTDHVAFLLSDDSSGAALLLYVGEKHAGGFLDRNGLTDGQLYAWKSDTGELSPSQFAAGTLAGSWVPIAAQDAGSAGQPGFDGAGYADAATLAAAADGVGAFSFRRPEDVSVNPADGTQAIFATTGINTSSDHAGTLYTVDVDFTDIANPTAAITVLYNASLDAAHRIRNPDNLDWADDGRIYVQEDRATSGLFGPGAVNPHEASVLRVDPGTGVIERVAGIDRSAVPFGVSDPAAGDVGNWESSGILDVSVLFGRAPGTLFLADVQAHSLVGGMIGENGLVAGGQLVIITAPGLDLALHLPVSRTPLDGVDRVVGSVFADTIVGDALANRLIGRNGDDRIDGGSGSDLLRGGNGADNLVGGFDGDTLAGGKGRDVFDFNDLAEMGLVGASRDRIKDFAHKSDRIDLATIDANGVAPGDGVFAFRGHESLTGDSTEIRWYQLDRAGVARDRTLVAGDADGDGRADFRIALDGLVKLTAVDFVL